MMDNLIGGLTSRCRDVKRKSGKGSTLTDFRFKGMLSQDEGQLAIFPVLFFRLIAF